MSKLKKFLEAWVLGLRLVGPVAGADIVLDAGNEGRVFEGLGAVSAGASSRLLVDYPEPQRSQILDYLFKPNFGAALQHLKVEIGGEVNSTDGTEPTHMRTRNEENYTRGYEWWLMQQAKLRNPGVLLDSLAWGAPGWIGNGSFYSQDMADYVVKFIKGAKSAQDLDINYTGIWNEAAYSISWIKLLRTTLDANGLGRVKIVVADVYDLNIVTSLQTDSVLSNSIYAIGRHYPGSQSTPAAQALGKPLWSAEDGIGGSTWSDARRLAKLFNRNYIDGKYTKTEIWSPITSYYDNLAAANSGLMRANTPWSGSYEVAPAIWAAAHTTQFAFPGWKYLEGGTSGYLSLGGSFVTFKSTNDSDYSVVVETMDAAGPQTVTFHLTNGLSQSAIKIWKTTATNQFFQLAPLVPVDGLLTFTFDPEGIYSFTTTSGQAKGNTTPPPAAPFPMPFTDDFEAYGTNQTPKYFCDQAGTFEVVTRTDGQGQSLRQVLPQIGIRWTGEFYPYTLLGDVQWKDYEVSVDFLLETNGFAYLLGRVANVPGFGTPTPNGYWLAVSSVPGAWELHNASGIIASGSATVATNTWHQLRLSMRGSTIGCYLDGILLANITDGTYASGMAGLGCGWHGAQFDNFSVRRLHRGPVSNLALTATATASSFWQSDSAYGPAKANDGDSSTRWNTAYPTASNEWLELDFPAPIAFNHAAYTEFGNRITGYRLQHWDGGAWIDDVVGGTIGASHSDTFAGAVSSRVRLLLTSFSSAPSIYEFGLYADAAPPNLALTATASASSVWSSGYTAAMANDNSLSTRWNSGVGTSNNQWLELDFPAAVNFNRTVLSQFEADRVTAYKIQYGNGTGWVDAVVGGMLGSTRTDTFPTVNSSKVRFYITTATLPASIYEFQVYYDLPANPAAAAAPLRINEWMVHNTRTLLDPATGSYESWFEIFNAGTTNIDLTGYYLSVSATNPSQFRIPGGYMLSPGGYQLVWADGATNASQGLHVNFALSNGLVLGLYDAQGTQVDAVDLDAQAPDSSSGGKPDGDVAIVPLGAATPGAGNALICATSIQRQPGDGSVVIGFSGLPFARHRIQFTENLGNGSWTNQTSVTANALGVFNYVETAPARPARDFRAVCP
jgi:galactosylceramidase